MSEVIDISNPSADFIPIEIRIPGEFDTSPPTIDVSVETSRGAQTMVATRSSQRGLRVIYTELLQASTFFPQPKDDVLIIEVAGYDAFSLDDPESTVDDTLAVFSVFGVGPYNRTLFRGHGRPDWSPELFGSHPPTRAFFRTGGAEVLTVRTLDAEPEATSVFVKNQSDIFFFSGHGSHEHGHLYVGDGVIRAADLVDWNGGDVEILVISGCSVLDISNYRIGSIPVLSSNAGTHLFYWLDAGGANNVGQDWEENVDADVLLGFAWRAPRDTAGGDEIAEFWAEAVMSGEDPVVAWQLATDQGEGRNAVAIDKRGARPVYFWWDEMREEPIWRGVVKGEDGWGEL